MQVCAVSEMRILGYGVVVNGNGCSDFCDVGRVADEGGVGELID